MWAWGMSCARAMPVQHVQLGVEGGGGTQGPLRRRVALGDEQRFQKRHKFRVECLEVDNG